MCYKFSWNSKDAYFSGKIYVIIFFIPYFKMFYNTLQGIKQRSCFFFNHFLCVFSKCCTQRFSWTTCMKWRWIGTGLWSVRYNHGWVWWDFYLENEILVYLESRELYRTPQLTPESWSQIPACCPAHSIHPWSTESAENTCSHSSLFTLSLYGSSYCLQSLLNEEDLNHWLSDNTSSNHISLPSGELAPNHKNIPAYYGCHWRSFTRSLLAAFRFTDETQCQKFKTQLLLEEKVKKIFLGLIYARSSQ